VRVRIKVRVRVRMKVKVRVRMKATVMRTLVGLLSGKGRRARGN
jgi:hypothetical protein